MAQSVQTPSQQSAQHGPSLVRGLSLMDSVMLMVGGIIGSGIFLTAGQIATSVHKPLYFLGVWLVGGVISLLACFAFAEMAAMYPEAGGQYVYMREAYGEFPAFLYGWMVFTVGQSGTIATLAVGFAEYFGAILPFASAHQPVATILGWTLTRGHLVSTAAIILLTYINMHWPEARLGAGECGDLGQVRCDGHVCLAGTRNRERLVVELCSQFAA